MTKRMKILSLTAFVCLILMFSLAIPAAADVVKGSNVWDQDQNMPSTYTWTPKIYSGLWYDIDKDIQTENITLSISVSDRQINAENAEYITEAKSNRFSYANWGSYRVIGWQGEPYFAGYTQSASGNNSTAQFAKSNISTLTDEKIYKVLSDTNAEKKIGSGGTLNLENGYVIRVSEMDESRNEFKLILEKGGSAVKSEIVSSNSTFVYEKTLGNAENVPIAVIHIKEVSGGETVIDGIFQISETAVDVNVNKKIDAMEIKSVNGTAIIMKNPSSIKLDAGKKIALMGYVKIDVKNTTNLKFELVSDPKTSYENKYPNRGTVHDNSSVKTWNGMSFKGFAYDYQNRTEIENLTFKAGGSIPRTLQVGDITYQTNAYNRTFNYSEWGSYQLIKLGGDEYFAGYTKYNPSDKNNTTGFAATNAGLLDSGRASRILINGNENRDYSANSTVNLEEGYSLQIGNSTDDKINLILKKNGTTVKEATVSENNDFVYETEINGTTIPLISIRILTIETNSVKIGGVFQISASPVDVSIGKTVGNMRIEYTGKNALMFVNKDIVELSKGKDVVLMENLSLHVADSDDLRFFPFGGTASNTTVIEKLRIEVPETIAPYQEITVKVSYQDSSSWKSLAGASVKVNGETVGETDSAGAIKYTLKNSGSYEFRAEKSGYQEAVIKKETTGEGKELFIEIPDFLFSEDAFHIYVKDKDNKNIPGAAIYKNNVHIGTTNDNGFINVTADSTPGTYALTASLSGYKPASRSMEVLEYGPYFTVASVSIPEETYANRTVKILMTVTNVGKENATQEFEIKAGDVTDVKKIKLNVGESKNITFNYKPNSAGTETITAGNKTYTLNVIEKPKTELPWKWIILGGGLLIIIIAAISALMYYVEVKENEQKNGKKKPQKEEKPKSGGKGAEKVSAEKAKPGKTVPTSSKSIKGAAAATKPSNRFSSSNKPPELKNSQKKARAKDEKK